MRIITGTARGVSLATPKGMQVRPTLDRVKESVFNILLHSLSFSGYRVLDLFAGTGNLGLEALSRGAEYALFVDNDMSSIKIVEENIRRTKMQERAKTVKRDVFTYLSAMGSIGEKFDMVFCDPPYNKALCDKLISAFDKYEIVNMDGIIVLEHSVFERLCCETQALDKYECWRTEKYGETKVTFLRRNK